MEVYEIIFCGHDREEMELGIMYKLELQPHKKERNA